MDHAVLNRDSEWLGSGVPAREVTRRVADRDGPDGAQRRRHPLCAGTSSCSLQVHRLQGGVGVDAGL